MWDFLKGTRILDLSRLLPGPYATLLLADLGAEVIKVEDPAGGDPLRLTPPFIGDWSYRFAQFNRNKKSVALNLKSADGRRIFLELCRQADALVETFRPGVTERLAVDCESVRNVNPRIVYCSLTGYGQTGPYRERVGHDLNYLGVAGLLSLTGREKPEIPGTPVADLAGGMCAALTVLAALARRSRTGEGAFIDVAMTDVAFSWLAIHLAELFAGGAAPGPDETILLGAFPCYAIYETADGKHLAVGALEPKFWQNLCAVLERPDAIPHQFDAQQREGIFADFRAIFKTRTSAAWLVFLSGQEIPVTPVNDLREALADPQIEHRGLVKLLTSGGLEIKQVAFPARFDRSPEESDAPPPRLGQQTREVLEGMGYKNDAIEELRARGVIAL